MGLHQLTCTVGCFFVGGLFHKEQSFHAIISEVGSGILLVAGVGLCVPSVFYSALIGAVNTRFTAETLDAHVLSISHATAIILMISFAIYIIFNAISHDNIFKDILEADEAADRDRHKDLAKAKFTLVECIIAITLALVFISLIAVFLVEEIPYIVANGVPDMFLGLILVPLVEKAAEHLTAIDEAYDNQINFALYHCLGPSVQTALFNAPLVVIIGWGLNKPMDLNFEIFMIVMVILSILVVGNFLRDGSSNYLEGALLIVCIRLVLIPSKTWLTDKHRSSISSSPSPPGIIQMPQQPLPTVLHLRPKARPLHMRLPPRRSI